MQNWKAKLRPRRQPQGKSGSVRHIVGDAPDVRYKDAEAAQMRDLEATLGLTPEVRARVLDVAVEFTARRLGPRSACLSEASREAWEEECWRMMDFAERVAVLARGAKE